jgi:hypothetical protein
MRKSYLTGDRQLIHHTPKLSLLIAGSFLMGACSSPNIAQSPPAPKPVVTVVDARQSPATAPAPATSPAPTAPAPRAVIAPAPAPTAPAAPTTAANTGSSLGISSGSADANATMKTQAGLHRCELGRKVLVRKVAPDLQSTQLQWLGKDYTLTRVNSDAGALRFEDKKAGIAWIAIVGQSMLMDIKKGQRLASQCNL